MLDTTAPDITARSLDGMVPAVGAGFACAWLLAWLRTDARGWLGGARIKRMAAELHLSERELLRLLDRPPKAPTALGDPNPWTGRRVPLLHHGAVLWAELFWRPDRLAKRHRIGAFALRLTLPATGRIELRGRLEEHRIDMVMETEHPLPRRLAADIKDSCRETLDHLGLEGSLTIRTQPSG
jgi:hypothetical protein